MRTSQKSITEVCRILICSLADHAANRSVSQGADALLRTIEETCFSTISKGECYRIILFDDLRTFGNLILIKKQEVLIVVFVNAYLTDEEKKLLRRQKYLIQDGEYLNIC